MTTHDEGLISTQIETYRQRFLALNPARLGSIWDKLPDTAHLHGTRDKRADQRLPAIEAQSRAAPEHLKSIPMMQLDGISIGLRGEAAVAYFSFRAKAKLKGRSGSRGECAGGKDAAGPDEVQIATRTATTKSENPTELII